MARDVDRVGDDEVDVAVDAAAGVPAAAGELVADLDRDDVLRVAVGVRVREVDREAGVAVGVAGHLLAVEEDDRVHVDAVELERDALVRGRAREREGLAVPAEAALEVAGVAGRPRGRGVELDAPVVREVDAAPRAVVIARVGGVGVGAGGVGDVRAVDERELPPAVEVAAALRGALVSAGRRGEGPDQRAREDERQHPPAATRHDPLLPQNESLRKQTTETEGSVPAAGGLETTVTIVRSRMADSVSTELERWLQSDGEKTLGQPRRALRGEELRDPLRAPARRAGAAAADRRRHARVRDHRGAARRCSSSPGATSIWLPQRWCRLELAGERQRRFIAGLMKMIRRLERFSRPRLTFLFDHRLSNIVFGLLVIAGCAGAFLAPPFTGLDTLPALGVVLLSLGVLLEDFLIVVAGDRRRRRRGPARDRARQGGDQGHRQPVLSTPLLGIRW